jgi:hypothetical protein
MMMMYVHLNFHGAKISDENKQPNFLLVKSQNILDFKGKDIKICTKLQL